jgi:hypothetical protein
MIVSTKTKRNALVLVAMLAATTLTLAQSPGGEIRVAVLDPQGAALSASAELVSAASHVHRTFKVDGYTGYVARNLPFGVYRLKIRAVGFATWIRPVEIRSEAPVRLSVKLALAPVSTRVDVDDSLTLLDAHQVGTQYSIGRQAIAESLSPQTGRSLSDAVDALPGWLYEGNGTLHPRGSEYDVQYVVNGIPLTQNRSPAFAPSLNGDDVESLRVLTAGYPAEYGRKLGGIVEVNSVSDLPTGLHGQFDAGGGYFSSASGSTGMTYSRSGNTFSIGGEGFHTDRYLDPPVLENFTNRGNSSDVHASYARDFSSRNQLHFSISHAVTRFLVPNYRIQESSGQRQEVRNEESSGQLYFQHDISSDLFLSVAGSLRNASAALTSNTLSTPVIVTQFRSYREGYVRADLAGHHGRHDWKVGVDGIFTPVHEALHYSITDPTQFDPGTQLQFQFGESRWDIEPSAYAQDQIRLGNWNLSAGARFDHYGFVVHKGAWSPRVGISRYVPSLKLSVHASYDRVFQTPAVENLLLASSTQLDTINSLVARLPVQPTTANYFEIGITTAFVAKLRLNANFFRRNFSNYSDDDALLDTGVSFPIAFASAHIQGEEFRLEVPAWGRFSGSVSYSNQTGSGQGPVTGGLFLGTQATGLRDTSKFPVSQDQRNTAHIRLRVQVQRRIWFSIGGQYGSGLPSEIHDADRNLLIAQYGPAILDQVNLERDRVRPNFSVNSAVGFELYRKEQRTSSVQIQGANLTNRINVINFASLFSGTAVAPPRSVFAYHFLSRSSF